MKPKICTQCGIEIEGKPVSFRGHSFCSDECCEEHTEIFAAKGGPAEDDLDGDLDAGLDVDLDEDVFDDDDLGYKDDEDDDDEFEFDDDYDIKPDDY